MCGGLEYECIDPDTGLTVVRKTFFPIPKARLPVLGDPSDPRSVTLVQWGRRQGEDPDLDIPVTGWARLLSLKEGRWNRYNPKRVRIPALRWMEKDIDRQSHWFAMDPGHHILGVQIEVDGLPVVYVVTRPATGHYARVHARMPYLTRWEGAHAERVG